VVPTPSPHFSHNYAFVVFDGSDLRADRVLTRNLRRGQFRAQALRDNFALLLQRP